MRLTHRVVAGILLAAVAVFVIRSFPSRGAGDPPAVHNWATDGSSEQFIVHEWGTFTSFSGSDSVKLEFRPLVDADLPPFVLDRGGQAGIYNPYSKLSLRVLQRMETPVTYFYSNRVRQVRARVEFPQGLLTEFFPPVAEMLPEFRPDKADPLTDSALDWGNVWIIPENRLQISAEDSKTSAELQARLLRKLLPTTDAHDHYGYARETDAALVSVERPRIKQRPFAPAGSFYEKFLFYRGVGNFELPLTLAAQANGQFELQNTGEAPIRGLFLVTVDGAELRFARYDQIRPGQKMTLTQSARASTADELAQEVVGALVAERLYEKEARAMVKTWRASWFEEQGTRLFYLLPQPATEKLLPLTITPTPDEMVRVMVGRLEIMTPEDERRITQLVDISSVDRANAAAEKQKNSEAAPYAFPAAILKLGRLAEPALVRVKNIATTPELRYEATVLLNELQQQRNAAAAIEKSLLQ